jgi:hypothetical protein
MPVKKEEKETQAEYLLNTGPEGFYRCADLFGREKIF